jgi:hypothetical protein
LVEPRIYRASLLLALVGVVVMMFSLDERPPPLAAKLAPDAFKGENAYNEAQRLASRYPDRRPGTQGDRGLGDLVEARFRGLGLETSRDRFSAEFDGHDSDMSNVVGLLSAPSDRQVVILAHRDAAGRPGAASAAATATLLQLASALDGSSRRKTFVFVSTDGAAADMAGARRFAEHYPDRAKIDAMIVLDDVAATEARSPYVVPWSSGSQRIALQVERTATLAVERETGLAVGTESWGGQFMRQAWPLALREQGPLAEAGLDAVTLTARGELPRAPDEDGLGTLSATRLAGFGRAAFASGLAYDGAPSIRTSPSRYVESGHAVIPGWAFSLLALGIVLPALVAAFDAFARANRRRLGAGTWVAWGLAASVPFALTLLAAFAFELVGWLPGSPSEALAPATRPTFIEAAPPLALLVLILALGWALVRPLAMGRTRGARIAYAPAAVALALLLALEVVVVCLMNPFTALLLAPAVHVAVLSAMPRSPRPAFVAGGLALGALALPLAALVYYGGRLDLGVDVIDYALMIVTAATGSVPSVLMTTLLAGTLTSSLLLAASRPRPASEDRVTVRGPVTYAGPGSLGGTESALRR